MTENGLNYLSLAKSGLVVRMLKTFIVRVLLVEGNEHRVWLSMSGDNQDHVIVREPSSDLDGMNSWRGSS